MKWRDNHWKTLQNLYDIQYFCTRILWALSFQVWRFDGYFLRLATTHRFILDMSYDERVSRAYCKFISLSLSPWTPQTDGGLPPVRTSLYDLVLFCPIFMRRRQGHESMGLCMWECVYGRVIVGRGVRSGERGTHIFLSITLKKPRDLPFGVNRIDLDTQKPLFCEYTIPDRSGVCFSLSLSLCGTFLTHPHLHKCNILATSRCGMW